MRTNGYIGQLEQHERPVIAQNQCLTDTNLPEHSLLLNRRVAGHLLDLLESRERALLGLSTPWEDASTGEAQVLLDQAVRLRNERKIVEGVVMAMIGDDQPRTC